MPYIDSSFKNLEGDGYASHERGVYARFIPEEKAEVGKRAALPAEHGMVETVLGLHAVLPKSGLGTSCLGSTSTYEFYLFIYLYIF